MNESTCIDLREVFPAYRVTDGPDREPNRRRGPWDLEIRGRYGWVRPYGGTSLLAYTDRPMIRARLRPLGEVRQEGDFETLIRLEAADAGPVLDLLRCRKRVVLSPEERERRAALGRKLANDVKNHSASHRKGPPAGNAGEGTSKLPDAFTGLVDAREGK